MFEHFLKYVEEEKKIKNKEDFIEQMNGKTFLKGLYRLFDSNKNSNWCSIVEQAFPKYKNYIDVFGYDWLGRIFAINKINNHILLFEPGTGEVLDIPVTFEEFHDSEIVECHEDCLASEFFQEWFLANDNYILKKNECVGYKVPLFLNGEDEIENLEISDMEVYWTVLTPLINI